MEIFKFVRKNLFLKKSTCFYWFLYQIEQFLLYKELFFLKLKQYFTIFYKVQLSSLRFVLFTGNAERSTSKAQYCIVVKLLILFIYRIHVWIKFCVQYSSQATMYLLQKCTLNNTQIR